MTSRDIVAKLKAEAAEFDGDGDENWINREWKRFERSVEDAKEFFGLWDICDPVVHALLRVVKAQNDLAHAYDTAAEDIDVGERMLEAAFAERIAAITFLYEAIKQSPRGPLSDPLPSS